MARKGNVRYSISADADGVKRGTREADRALDRLNTSGKKHFGGFAKSAIGAGAAFVGAHSIYSGLQSVVQASMEAEQSQARLQAQLKALGISYRSHAGEIEKVIQKTSQLSGLDDERLQDSFTNIVRVTGDVNKALNLTGLAADFARAKHMDVAKAGEIVGKVAGGNIGILSRYGIVIKDGASSTEALAELQRRFAGQAAAYGKTTGGSFDRARVAVENLREKIGDALAPTLSRVANRIATFVNQMNAGTGAGGRFRARMEETWAALQPLIRALGRVAGAISGLVSWFGRASARVVAFIEDVAKGTRQTGAFASKIGTVVGALRSAVIWLGKFAAVIVGGVGKAVGTIVDGFEKFASAVGKIVSGVRWLIEKIPKIPKFPKISLPSLPKIGGPDSNKLGNLPVSGVDQFTPVARRFGLQLTSGFRPGDDGYHGQNRARDFSNGSGPTPQMMDFARFMVQMYGSRLKELIYSPLGFGIKNGQRVPNSFWGATTVAGHYNHVHVAYARGGKVDSPMFMVGEEAPRHPEYVIPTNPRYRNDAVVYLAQAAEDLGIPGFRKGRGKKKKRPRVPVARIPDWPREDDGFDTEVGYLDLVGRDAEAQALVDQRRSALERRLKSTMDKLGKTPRDAVRTRNRLKKRAASLLSQINQLPSVSFPDAPAADIGGDGATDEAAQDLIDAITAQTEATQALAEAERQRTEELQALKAEIEKQNKFAESVTAVSLGEVWRALADVISGQIAGVAYTGRASTAGAGSTYRT